MDEIYDRKTALRVLQDLSKKMYPNLDIFGRPTLVINRADFEEVRKKYLDELDKNTVVLTKEEYRCLKDMADRYDPFWFCTFGGCEGAGKECKNTCEMSIFVQTRKETAEKLGRKFKEKLDEKSVCGWIDELPISYWNGFVNETVKEFLKAEEKQHD